MLKQQQIEKTPAQMFEERQKAIQKALSDKDVSIRTSWAINNAVLMAQSQSSEKKNIEGNIRWWTRWFLDYYDEVREYVLNKKVRELEEEEELEEEFIRDYEDEPDGFEGRIVKEEQ